MGPFMISSVNVALPAIQDNLKMNAVQLGWVSTTYLLAMAVALIPAGKLADIHGRKKVFSLGLIVYALEATLAAFVDATAWFLCLRAIQGLGAAMFVTTGMAILTSIFPPDKRGRAIGVYVTAVYVGLSVCASLRNCTQRRPSVRSSSIRFCSVSASPFSLRPT